MSKVKITFPLALILIFFAFSSSAHAQSFGETLDITITPANLTPGTHVFLNVKDVAANLDKTKITWSLNGKVMKSAIGAKDFEFDLGPLGSVSSVTVSTDVLTKNIKIRPTEIDLIWESDGYTPPFYKGRAMRAYQGNVRLVAIPHFFTSTGTELDPSKLIYTWRNRGVLNPDASGYGKNSLSYSGSVISRPLTIEVSAISVDGLYKGTKEITIEETEPSVFLYEDHPLYGVLYNSALNEKDFNLKSAELKVTAIPLNFSTKIKDDEKLKYSWSVNGSSTNNENLKDSVILRKEGNISGFSSVSLQLNNQTDFMQSATAAFRVKFNNK